MRGGGEESRNQEGGGAGENMATVTATTTTTTAYLGETLRLQVVAPEANGDLAEVTSISSALDVGGENNLGLLGHLFGRADLREWDGRGVSETTRGVYERYKHRVTSTRRDYVDILFEIRSIGVGE